MTMWKPNLSLRIAGLLILLIIFVIVSSIASAALDSWTSYEDQNLGLAMDVPKAWVISPADEITETRTSATVIATHDNGDPAQGYPLHGRRSSYPFCALSAARVRRWPTSCS